MISFKINCPSCNQKVSISVKESDLGTRYRTSCPSCVSPLVLNLPNKTRIANHIKPDTPAKTTIVSNTKDTVKYQLLVEENILTEKQEFILNQPYLSFGRLGSLSNSDLELITKDKSISRKHCIFRLYSNGITIEDVSLGGTLLNNKKLPPKNEVFLKDGDRLRMGQTMFNFIVSDGTAKS